mgnify:CR=1 FL=1
MSNHIICFSPSGATLGQRILAVEDVFAADWSLHSVSEQITKSVGLDKAGFSAGQQSAFYRSGRNCRARDRTVCQCKAE